MTTTPTGTNVAREWGFGKCYAHCVCGWVGRERNLTEANRAKAVEDCHRHARKCTKRGARR
jgi:hypothetical protein